MDGDRGQISLANASGASKSVVNQWLNEKIKTIDIKYALGIEAVFGYSHIWLMTGDGDPKVTGRPHVVMSTQDNTIEIVRLLSLYGRCDQRGREDIMQTAESAASGRGAGIAVATGS